jgi:predicted DCC family thiol-disulfide oxidoreductase YuxK
MTDLAAHPIVFYDGVCGLCDRSVQFILRHDTARRFRFAALQSDFAGEILDRQGRDRRDLDTMYVVLDAGTPTEHLLAKSDAVLAVLHDLGWRRLAAVAHALPRALRDRGYEFVARNRYRWFGRYEQCALPPPDVRERFVDLVARA